MAQSYTEVDMTGTYFKTPGWFFFFMPLSVPYGQLLTKIKEAGFTLKADTTKGMLEKGVAFGQGWIAMEIEPTATQSPNVFTLSGTFHAYEHIGPYKQIGEVFKKIMADFPQTKEFYSCYMNSPQEVSEDKLRTVIAFR